MADSAAVAKVESRAFLRKPDLLVGLVFSDGFSTASEPRRVSLAGGISGRFITGARRYVEKLQQSIPVPYQVGYTPSDAEVLFVKDDPSVESAIDMLTPVHSLAETDGSKQFLRSVSAVTVLIETDAGERLTLFRRYTKGKFLLKRTAGYRLVYRGGAYDDIDEDVVQLEDRYDCLHWDDYTLISGKNGFERLFEYDALWESRAESTADVLSGSIGVSDSRLFKTLLTGDRRLFGKLESVRRRQVHNKVTVEAIEAFCVARSIPVGFEDSDLGHRVITVEDSPEWRSRYLSILDDDHLTSELTNAQYQATSKIDWGHS